MFNVCLTIFSSISSPLQSVSYVKVYVYCVFDYFLCNLVSTLDCELRKSACLLCLTIFTTSDCDELFVYCLMLQHIHSHTLTRSVYLFYNRRRVPLESHYLLSKLSI